MPIPLPAVVMGGTAEAGMAASAGENVYIRTEESRLD